MAFTLALIDELAATGAERVLLVRCFPVDDGGTETEFRFASDDVVIGGEVFDGAITKAQPVEVRSELLSGGPDLAVWSFTLAKEIVARNISSDRLVRNYDWRSKKVVAFLWVKGSAEDPAQIFSGKVFGYSSDLDGLTLNCKQDNLWNATIPDAEVTKVSYPNAPESSFGLRIPIIVGKRIAPQLAVPPWPDPYGANHLVREKSGAGSLVNAGVVVDAGRGATGGVVQVQFASHKLSVFGDPSVGAGLYIRAGEALAQLEISHPDAIETLPQTPTVLTMINDEIGARFSTGVGKSPAWAAVFPIDSRPEFNSAKSPLNALDPFKSDTYAEIVGGQTLELIVGDGEDLGTIIEAYRTGDKHWFVWFALAYSTDAGAPDLFVNKWSPASSKYPPGYTDVFLAATDGHENAHAVMFPYFQGTDNAPASIPWWHDVYGWNFGGGGVHGVPNVDAFVKFRDATALTARIYWACIVVHYQPRLRTVRSGSNAAGPIYDVAGRIVTGKVSKPGVRTFGEGIRLALAGVYENDSDYFCNAYGMPDDDLGTFTGVPARIVELVPDVLSMLLQKYGGIDPGDIESGGGEHGSFADARSQIQTIDGYPITVARCISDQTTISDVATELAANASSLWFVNRLTGKHSLVMWDQDAQSNYRKLMVEDLLDNKFSAELTSDVSIVNGISARYAWDDFRRGYVYQASTSYNQSRNGFAYNDERDGSLTVYVDKNDALDFLTDSDGLCVAVFDAGYYTGIGLAQHVRSRMKAAAPTKDIKIEWGFDVVAGYNDLLPVEVGGVTYEAFLTAGSYRSGTALAAEVVRALAAAGTGATWQAWYNYPLDYRSTRRFYVLGSTAWRPMWATCSDPTRSSASLLGFPFDADGASTKVDWFSENERRGETIYIGFEEEAHVYTNTGVNKAKSAGVLLGFPSFHDPSRELNLVGATTAWAYEASSRRHWRERSANASRHRNGFKQQLQFDCPWFNTTPVATNYRDRVFDWRVEPIVQISFSTMRMPDAERGMVFEVADDMDSIVPYPRLDLVTAGNWAGRRFMITEVRQVLGDRWEQEIVAVECSRNAGDGPPAEPGILPGAGTLMCNQVIVVAPNNVIEWGSGGGEDTVVIDGSNDGIRANHGFGYYVCSIAHGTYTYRELSERVRDALRAGASPDDIKWMCSYGTSIRAGYHTKLQFIVSGTLYTVDLTPANYNPTELAAEAQSKMNAAGSPRTFTVTYSANKITFAADGAWTLVGVPDGTEATYDDLAVAVFGVRMGDDYVQSSFPYSRTAHSEVYDRQFNVNYPGVGGAVDWSHASSTARATMGYGLTTDFVGFSIAPSAVGTYTSGSSYSFEVPPGTYSYGNLAAVLEAGMRANGAGTERVWHGTDITAGHNDDWSFYEIVGGTPYLRSVILVPSSYTHTGIRDALQQKIGDVSVHQYWVGVNSAGGVVLTSSGEFSLPTRAEAIGGGWRGMSACDDPAFDGCVWTTATTGFRAMARHKFDFLLEDGDEFDPSSDPFLDTILWSRGGGPTGATGQCGQPSSTSTGQPGPPIVTTYGEDVLEVVDVDSVDRTYTFPTGDEGYSYAATNGFGTWDGVGLVKTLAAGYGPHCKFTTFVVLIGTDKYVRNLPGGFMKCQDVASLLTYVLQAGDTNAPSFAGFVGGPIPVEITVTYDGIGHKFSVAASSATLSGGVDSPGTRPDYLGSGWNAIGFEPAVDTVVAGTVEARDPRKDWTAWLSSKGSTGLVLVNTAADVTAAKRVLDKMNFASDSDQPIGFFEALSPIIMY